MVFRLGENKIVRVDRIFYFKYLEVALQTLWKGQFADAYYLYDWYVKRLSASSIVDFNCHISNSEIENKQKCLGIELCVGGGLVYRRKGRKIFFYDGMVLCLTPTQMFQIFEFTDSWVIEIKDVSYQNIHLYM